MGKKVSQREVTLDHTESPQRMTAQRGEDILEGVGPSPWKKAIGSRWRNMGGRDMILSLALSGNSSEEQPGLCATAPEAWFV